MTDVRHINHDEIKNTMSHVLNTDVIVEIFNNEIIPLQCHASKFKFSKYNVNISIVVRHVANSVSADVAAYAQAQGETSWDSLDVVMRVEDMEDTIKLIRYIHDVADNAHDYAASLTGCGGDPSELSDHANNASALRQLISKLRSNIQSAEYQAHSESYMAGYIKCLDDMEALLPEHTPEDRLLYVFDDPNNVKLVVDGVIQRGMTQTYNIGGSKA